MALKGDLKDFSTTQLLNLINLARKTGTLIIESSDADEEGNREELAQMAFREGKLIHASMVEEDGHLANILHKAGKLTEAQAKLISEKAASMGDKELGLLLINAGYVTRDDILQSVKQHTLDVVYNLLTWNEGHFRFEDGMMPPDDRITVPIDLENVILEGTRRLRELEQLQEELPNLDFALKFPDRPGTSLRDINLSVDEWRVVSFINPKNSIRQIAKANNMSEMEIRRIVYGLLQAGLVELVRPPSMVQPLNGRRGPERPKIKKTVVTRLIDRIRSL